MRGARLLAHGLADAAGHGVEPLADRLGQLGLARAEHLGHRAEPALHLRLRLQDAGHPGVHLARPVGRFRRPPCAPATARQSAAASATISTRKHAATPPSAMPSEIVVAPRLSDRLAEQQKHLIHVRPP